MWDKESILLMGVSIYIGYLCQFCIIPQLFEAIKFARLGEEYVNKDISIVYYYPLSIAIALIGNGLYAGVLARVLSHAIGYCLYLCGCIALAYNKVIGR